MHDFSKRVGFVTGGGSGIGLACAAAIVAGGGRVLIGGRRESVLESAACLDRTRRGCAAT
jgi:NADP-dependent 3-hydroxy acid dehydrogenase YdfG